MTRRDGLDALPFSDYADPDPHGQLRIGDEPQPEEVPRSHWHAAMFPDHVVTNYCLTCQAARGGAS